MGARTFPATARVRGVRPRFDDGLALAGSDEQVAAWEASCARILGALSLVAPDGPVAAFLLHIEGDAAWFRWSDEPLDTAR